MTHRVFPYLRIASCVAVVYLTATATGRAGQTDSPPARQPATQVSIEQGRWHIDGKITYPGAPAEGLLMNVRMVNATFEDRQRTDFDPDASTAEFLKRLPEYVDQGVRGFTFCLQGGMPGYEGAVNSAFEADGSLRPEYLARIRRVIEACDKEGAVVILGCYYQRQDQILRDADAVRAGVVNVVNWIKESGFTNVVLEISNEYDHGGFDHRLLKSTEGQVELIRLAKKTNPKLLVSTSGLGHGRMADAIAEVADFILIHFNGTPVERIPDRIAALKKFDKPIVCNEDDKQGRTAARAAELSVAGGASWGLMLSRKNQYRPFEFDGAADDPVVYAKLKELTTAARRQSRADSKPDADSPEADVLRVMTFNIRNSRARDGVNAWPHRRDHVADVIRDNGVDVVGMQECLPDQIDDLEERLPDYAWYGVGREDGKKAGEFCAVFYRKDRLERIEAGEFWLSETPEKIASKSWDAAIERIVTRIVFRDERTGRKFVFFNTHFDHEGAQARAESAKLILKRVRAEEKGTPVVVVGDFNTTPESAPYRVLTRGNEGDAAEAPVLRDARGISKKPPQGPDSTWNAFRAIEPGRRIDFILVSKPVECLSHRILDEQRDGRFASDHLPVLAELRIPE
ncbi:MAG: endonuclease/exonuclease/phosphatase family protein [Planctomycetaceae bacterium]